MNLMRPLLFVLALGMALPVAEPVFAQSAVRSAQDSCVRAAQDRRLRVVDVGRLAERYGRDRRTVVGYDVPLRIQTDRGSSWVSCYYDRDRRRAELQRGGWDEGGNDRDRPSARETANACSNAGERRGYRISRIVSQSDQIRQRRASGRIVAMDASRDGSRYRLNCYYDFRSRDTQLEAFRR